MTAPREAEEAARADATPEDAARPLERPDARTLERDAQRTTLTIALGAGIASLSMNFWVPFLPLYLRDLGATSDADALFWAAVAATVQGIARLVAGPAWGLLSDRYGRKLMYLRALWFASFTMVIAALATEPWHVAIAFGFQGAFSGFVPAAIALTSVSVPDARLNRSLGTVTAAVYLGNTLGPAIGAILAVVVGYRGAIVGGAVMPALASVLALITVRRDVVASRARGEGATTEDGSIRALLTAQFALALLVYFLFVAFNQLLRLATPVALDDLAGEGGVAGASGVAFTLGGLASVVGVLAAQRFIGAGRLRRTIIGASAVTGLAHFALPLSGTVPAYVAAFALISMVQAAVVPAANTLIAANAPRARRGTAFGFASGVQAVAFMAGPAAAAWFAAVSLDLGFVVLGVLFLALGALVVAAVREPAAEARPPSESS